MWWWILSQNHKKRSLPNVAEWGVLNIQMSQLLLIYKNKIMEEVKFIPHPDADKLLMEELSKLVYNQRSDLDADRIVEIKNVSPSSLDIEYNPSPRAHDQKPVPNKTVRVQVLIYNH